MRQRERAQRASNMKMIFKMLLKVKKFYIVALKLCTIKGVTALLDSAQASFNLF